MRRMSKRRILKTGAAELLKLALYEYMLGGRANSEPGDDLADVTSERFLCVAEVKRTDKSNEIKYVDRIKAAQLMLELARLEADQSITGESFLESFKKAAESLKLPEVESGDLT